jgi:riboflavin synthase
VAVDGVSLTVAGLRPGRFAVALIPHTLAVTTLGRRGEGDQVNLEVDILAKYVERLLEGARTQDVQKREAQGAERPGVQIP